MKRIYLGLIFKIILIFVSAWIAYGLIEDNSLLWIFITSLAVALITFLVGDMLIFPRYGNVSGAVADAVLAGIIAWIIDMLSDNFYVTWLSTLVFVVLIFIIEMLLHRYLESRDT
jgi:ABC-type Mn2+/Zn2+ transport system permease subunit